MECKVIWKSKFAFGGKGVKANLILEPEVGLTIINDTDLRTLEGGGEYLTCANGPLSPNIQPNNKALAAEIWPLIENYTMEAIAKGVFDVDEMDQRLRDARFGAYAADEDPSPESCSFNA